MLNKNKLCKNFPLRRTPSSNGQMGSGTHTGEINQQPQGLEQDVEEARDGGLALVAGLWGRGPGVEGPLHGAAREGKEADA